jgi:hypothetical protein
MTTDTKLTRIAHHEAGHAIAAMRLKLRLLEVSIERGTRKRGPNGEFVGQLGLAECRPTNRYRYYVKARKGDGYIVNPRIRSSQEDVIIMSLAGPRAEERYGEPNKRGWADDYNSAWEGALKLEDGEKERAEALLKKLDMRAFRLVVHHWEEIQRLAQLLLAHCTVTAKQARVVLEK